MRTQRASSLLVVSLASLALVGCGKPAEGQGDGHGHDHTHDYAEPTAAVCILQAVGDSGVSGTIHFKEVDGAIRVSGEVRGLTPGKHGFHVHTFGNVTDLDTGKSAGGHFSPGGHDHGKPGDDVRHVGDLGNIEANDDGVAKIEMTDDVIALHGENSIVGRAIVVHRDPDDFGQPTGNAGPRVGVGVIGIAAEKQHEH